MNSIEIPIYFSDLDSDTIADLEAAAQKYQLLKDTRLEHFIKRVLSLHEKEEQLLEIELKELWMPLFLI